MGALTASLPVTLTDNGEPTVEDGNNDTSLTVDFGFIAASVVVTAPQYDYGAGGLSPTGPAPDGEVEDYLVGVIDSDFGNSLAVGESGVIQVVIRVNSGGRREPFTCSSTARGVSPAGVLVTDISQDGDDPDPDNNGDPGDNGDPTVITLPVSVLEIPTAGTWGLLILASLLACAAVWRLRM